MNSAIDANAVQELLSMGLDHVVEAEPALVGQDSGGSDHDSVLVNGCGRGARIGRYELLEPIGEGGFGVVWLARQFEPIEREVALKMLKPGMDSREIVYRFAAERQALAHMDHPNIAGVLDAGSTEGGRLYFVMERIDGPPITRYCDERQMPLVPRIGLFLDVCAAVQHAHRKALIHRDLKPSNILVCEAEGLPIPKVIDFGIAKALSPDPSSIDSVTFTRTGSGHVFGTLDYMSPEQAGGRPDVDTRSDVYALGVILHELLTGETPLEATATETHESVLKMIREGETRRPSGRFRIVTEGRVDIAIRRSCSPGKLEKMLRGDLDWILLRALEKDRERRYQSVEEFADDLNRHIRNEPVKAGPPSTWYRLRKFARRNRFVIASASTAIGMLLIGLGIAATQAVRAIRSEQVAQSRLEMAEQARDAAETLLNDTIVGLRERLLPVGKTELMNDSIESARLYLDRLPKELDNRRTQEQAVFLAYNQGGIALFEGRIEDSKTHLEEAIRGAEYLEAGGGLKENLQEEMTFLLILAAKAYYDSNDFETSARYRSLATARCEAWLEKHPEARWAYSCQALASSLAAVEAVLHRRTPRDALPYLLKLKNCESSLARIDDTSLEYHQVNGLHLISSGFAAEYLGKPPIEVIDLFERAGAAFRLAAERDQQATYRTVYIDMQLSAETAAGTRLLDLGAGENDPVKIQRGRDFILGAFSKRIEMTQWDPKRIEWWRDLSESCKEVVKVAEHSKEDAEAERLVGQSIKLAPTIASRIGENPDANQSLCRAIIQALRWKVKTGMEWTKDDLAALKTAHFAWSRIHKQDPGVYNSRRDIEMLVRLLRSARMEAGEVLRPEVVAIATEVVGHFRTIPAPSEAKPLLLQSAATMQFQIGVAELSSIRPSAESVKTTSDLISEMLENLRTMIPGDALTAFDSHGELTSVVTEWLENLPRAEWPGALATLRPVVEKHVELTIDIARRTPQPGNVYAVMWGALYFKIQIEHFERGGTSEETSQKLVETYRSAEQAVIEDEALWGKVAESHLSFLAYRGWTLMGYRKPEMAIPFQEEIIRIVRGAPLSGPERDYQLGRSHLGLAVLRYDRENPGSSLRSIRAAAAALDALFEADPTHLSVRELRFTARLLENTHLAIAGHWNDGDRLVAALSEEQDGLDLADVSDRTMDMIDHEWARLHDELSRIDEKSADQVIPAWTKIRTAFVDRNPSPTYIRHLRPIPESSPRTP